MHPRSKPGHLLDYIIVRYSDLKNVLITQAKRGAECWTDHRMIMAMLKMRIRPAVRLRKITKKGCTALAGRNQRHATASAAPEL